MPGGECAQRGQWDLGEPFIEARTARILVDLGKVSGSFIALCFPLVGLQRTPVRPHHQVHSLVHALRCECLATLLEHANVGNAKAFGCLHLRCQNIADQAIGLLWIRPEADGKRVLVAAPRFTQLLKGFGEIKRHGGQVVLTHKLARATNVDDGDQVAIDLGDHKVFIIFVFFGEPHWRLKSTDGIDIRSRRVAAHPINKIFQ